MGCGWERDEGIKVNSDHLNEGKVAIAIRRLGVSEEKGEGAAV